MRTPGAAPQTAILLNHLSRPVRVELDGEEPTPAQTLADLYRRCATGGGCPHKLDSLIRVLTRLRYRGAVVATEIGASVGLPPSAVYGCVLELEDLGLVQWIPEPVTSAEYVTAEITAVGARFLREIRTREVRSRAG